MPAGPEAPGIRTAGGEEEVLLSLEEEDRIIVVDEDEDEDEDDDMVLGKGHDHYFVGLLIYYPI